MAGITTILVVGFPVNVQQRELTNLCRYIPGYEDSCVVKGNTVFVKFQSAELANAAIFSINGTSHDPADPHTLLKAEFAKREMEPRMHPTPVQAMAMPMVNPMAMQMPMMTQMQMFAQYGAAAAGGLGYAAAPMPAVGGLQMPNDEIATLAVLGAKTKGYTPEVLQQWFQAIPGFVTLQVNDRIDGTFIRFVNRAAAEVALQVCNQENLGAEWARRNLDPSDTMPRSAMPQVAAFGMDPATQALHMLESVKRQRTDLGTAPSTPVPGAPVEMNTITVLGIKAKGLEESDLTQWFSGMPGYVTLQASRNTGGVFIKFTSQALADQALQQANLAGFGAEWARRNLDEGAGPQAYVTPGMNMGAQVRTGTPGEIDTITVFASKSTRMSKEQIHQWFHTRPGFAKLQVNERINATFVKFVSRAAAEQALLDAPEADVVAEWARRNME